MQTLILLALLAFPPVSVHSPMPAEITGDNFALKLTNDSGSAIIALVVIWTVNEHGVPVGSMKIIQDFYTDAPQINAHSDSIISYNGLMKLADVGTPATVDVDAVLYEDGTVGGRNNFGLKEYIEEKWAVRDRIARDLLAFKGKEDQIKGRLDLYESEVPDGPGKVSNWKYQRHRIGIVRGWALFYEAMLSEDKQQFWAAVEEIAKEDR